MSNYCILSIEKIHSMGSLQMRHEHNFRELPLKHVDISASDRNEELTDDSGLDYRDLWYRRIKDVELATGKAVAMRSTSVIAYEIVTTFSREAEIDLDAWKEENVKWMKKTFGAENVLSMQYHDDETTPHIHSIVVPIDNRGKLCAKSFTGGRAKMFALQTSYAKAMEPLGLTRGEMYSRSKKSDLNRYYSQINKAADAEAPKMMPGENVDSYVSRVNAYIQDMEMKSLWVENSSKREVELAQTKSAQFMSRYGEAVKLQNELEESFDGDMEMVRSRLKTYQKIERSVPRKTLNGLLESIMKKFPVTENVLMSRWDRFKRKKKKSNSEIDINM